jgi:hypothetical protein
MAKMTGNFGSGQTVNGVVELISPLTMVWRRPIGWGGGTSMSSNGVSIVYDNTNLPLEGTVVLVQSDGDANVTVNSGHASAYDLQGLSLALVWTGYDQHDSGAIDTITVIDSGHFLFDVSPDRCTTGAEPAAGTVVYYDSDVDKFTNDPGATTDYNHPVGVCEGERTASGLIYYRIKWTRS